MNTITRPRWTLGDERELAVLIAATLGRVLFGNDFAKGGLVGGLLGEGLKWLGGLLNFGGAPLDVTVVYKSTTD